MQVTKEQLSSTKVKLTIIGDQKIIDQIKAATLAELSPKVKVPGFRPGKAPAHIIEKAIDQAAFQTEFLEQAVNHFYVEAAKHEKLRPVSQPQISITKFVPFTTLEFTAEVESVGKISLPDYKKVKVDVVPKIVNAKDVDEVINNLLTRGATKQPVDRKAKDGDVTLIDFVGNDAKTKAPISGADGKDYPLTLGSKSFIPGFEEELIGAIKDQVVDFTITFPKDYGVKALQSRKVTFKVTVKEVSELVKPKLDDAFAKSVGPFKTVAELKVDIKKQLEAEAKNEFKRVHDNELLEKISNKSEVAVPVVLIEDEIDRMEDEEKSNVTYRGQTWQEHLDEEQLTAEAHRAKQRVGAEMRVKAGLVLAEIADKENIIVTPEELEIRIQLLKGQYNDSQMQAQLDMPEYRRDIMNRMISEKTLDRLRSSSHKK
jgi:trigger factor